MNLVFCILIFKKFVYSTLSEGLEELCDFKKPLEYIIRNNSQIPRPIIKEIYEVPLEKKKDSKEKYCVEKILKDIESTDSTLPIPKDAFLNKKNRLNTEEDEEEDQSSENSNIPLFARKPENDSSCYIASIQGKPESFLEALKSMNARILYKYNRTINAVAFCLKSIDDITELKQTMAEYIKHIEPDTYYFSAGVQVDPPSHMYYMMNYMNKFFTNWVLNNKAMNFLPFRYFYKFFYTYYKYDFTGKNVMIYMLDTSVDVKHEDLKGRVKNMFSNNMSCSTHGTSVALLIGGKTHGFAKDSLIKVLNVLDCDGRAKLSDILFAIETIRRNTGNTAILYFGVTGPRSEIFNSIVDALSKQKIIIVSPAGNDRDLGCNYSPGSATAIINVGSVDTNASISNFSNFNNCIRIYSLGENIEIPNSLSSSKANLSGTSYSAAHVASAIAIYLESNPYADFKSVWKFVTDNSDIKNGYLVQKIPSFINMPKLDERELEPKCENGYMTKIFVAVIVISIIILILFLYRRRQRQEMVI